ncbi:hypothetical protein GCM10008967_38340 [Bacillus carboniphilus]|uniref:Lipoprotein n=1 Tax=Bacillus carboniphilus TaxID=86663 RepID=A0ABN0WQK3_9BACI
MKLIKRHHIFIVLLSLVMVGCSSSATNEKSESILPDFKAQFQLGGELYDLERGGYKWEKKLGFGKTMVEQTDHASPLQMAPHIDPISSNPKQEVTIHIENTPTLTLYLVNAGGLDREVSLQDNKFTLPDSPGKYIYEVRATWVEGEISYTFVVLIQ